MTLAPSVHGYSPSALRRLYPPTLDAAASRNGPCAARAPQDPPGHRAEARSMIGVDQTAPSGCMLRL
jgi:hypothetical protein